MGTDINGAYAVAEQVRNAVCAGKIKEVNSQKMLGQVTISIGVTQFNSSDLPNDLVAQDEW